MKYTMRFLSWGLALVLGLALSTPALSASVEQFSDVSENYWAMDDIAACAAQGIVTGYDGKFYPEDNVTGVQFVSMLIRTFYAEELSQVEVPDGQPWYYPHIKVAENLHISDSTLTFQDNAINRYDMARCLYNIINKEDKDITGDKIVEAANSIKDYTDIPVNRRMAVSHCYALGILTGISDGTFSGDSYMTRAQACTVIMRMMKLINGEVPNAAGTTQPQQPEETPETVPGQPLANGKPVTVENVQEILEELREQYPDGTAYNTKFTDGGYGGDLGNLVQQWKVRDLNTMLGLQSGCGGFASVITDSIFGRNGFPCRRVTRAEDLRPGDIIIGYTDTTHTKLSHISIVYKVWTQNGNTYYSTCDNTNSNNKGVVWNEPDQYNNGTNAATPTGGKFLVLAYTRYPE